MKKTASSMAVRILAAVIGGVNGSWIAAPRCGPGRPNCGAWCLKFGNRSRRGSWAMTAQQQTASATGNRKRLRAMIRLHPVGRYDYEPEAWATEWPPSFTFRLVRHYGFRFS